MSPLCHLVHLSIKTHNEVNVFWNAEILQHNSELAENYGQFHIFYIMTFN